MLPVIAVCGTMALPLPVARAQSGRCQDVIGVSVEVLRVAAWGLGAGGLLVQGFSTVAVEVAGPLSSPQVSLPPASSTTTRGLSTTTPSSVPSSITRNVAEPPGRLLPLPADESEHRSRPLWVGAVVGLSGLAGLLLSRALRGRAGATS